MQRLLIFLLLVFAYSAHAQLAPTDSSAKAKEKAMEDSLNNVFLSHAVYPLLKTSKFSGVIPVENPTEKLDPNLQYKLLFEVITGTSDSSDAKDINESFANAGRIINLHIAAGVPLKNLHVVMVVHGPALHAMYKNDMYRQKYNRDNPNLVFFDELQKAGVQMVACGQAMFIFNIKREELIPGVKVAYSARTAMTSYQMKGYVLHTHLDR
jgi:intracellular sulfur oxidation DsrE/DsrF family protein